MQLTQSKILVVDDESHNLTLLSKLLLRRGYSNVQTCDQPTKVSALVRQEKFDLILLDLTMPQVSGLEILEELRPELQAALPLLVLVLSGDNRSHSRRAALALGAKDFVCKPFDPPEVLSRIENLLELRSLHRRLQYQPQRENLDWLSALTFTLEASQGKPAQVSLRRQELAARLADHLELGLEQRRELEWGAKFYSLHLLSPNQRQQILEHTKPNPDTLLYHLLSHAPAPSLLLEILKCSQLLVERGLISICPQGH